MNNILGLESPLLTLLLRLFLFAATSANLLPDPALRVLAEAF